VAGGDSSIRHILSQTPSINITSAERPASREREPSSNTPDQGAALRDAWHREKVATAPTIASPLPPIGWDDTGETWREDSPTPSDVPLRAKGQKISESAPPKSKVGAIIAIVAAAIVVAFVVIFAVTSSGGESSVAGNERSEDDNAAAGLGEVEAKLPVVPNAVVDAGTGTGTPALAVKDDDASIRTTAPPAPTGELKTDQAVERREPKKPVKSRETRELKSVLDKAQKALNAGDYAAAKRLARRSMQVKPSGRGFSVLVQAYCGLGNIGAARDYLARVPRSTRSRVRAICKRKHAVELPR